MHAVLLNCALNSGGGWMDIGRGGVKREGHLDDVHESVIEHVH